MAPIMEFRNNQSNFDENDLIVFNASKNEIFKVTENMKILHKKLKLGWKISINKEEINEQCLAGARVFILGGPREKFSETEIESIKGYINKGGSVIVLLGEGGENEFDTNINFLLEEFGIMINNDCVVRTHYYKYYHPKEARVSQGVINRAITQEVLLRDSKNRAKNLKELNTGSNKIHFVYPYGATLNVAEPAIALLTSGTVCYPMQRPVAAYYKSQNKGKLLVIGSGYFVCDQYIDQEDNWNIWQTLLSLITTEDIQLNTTDINEPEISDYYLAGDIIYLANKPRLCLIDSIETEVPNDFKQLFNMELYSINTDLVPDVVSAYKKLSVQYEDLSIITPQFEIPLPTLELAIFPPQFMELQHPPLELFDLDEAFSSERTRLAQLTNKCILAADSKINAIQPSDSLPDTVEKELEYFVRECGTIMNICSEDSTMTGKEILNIVGLKIAHYKKLATK